MRTRRLIPVLAAALVAVPQAAARPSPAIQRQRAHERAVLAQIDSMSRSLERVIQAWDGARLRLRVVQRNLRHNELGLAVARQDLRVSQVRLERRLVELYEGGRPGTVDVLAGAKSLTDLIDGLEAAQAVSRQDAQLGTQIRVFEGAVTRREALLRRQRRARAAAVAALAARRRTISASLAEQRRLLASIHRTIRQIQAQEAARERRLQAALQARLRREAEARREAALQAAEDDPAQPAAPGLAPSPAPLPVPTGATGAGHPQAASLAAQYLGVPYVWGGEGTGGFDCSGLVAYVYAQLGISLPHYTVSQWNATLPISSSDLQPGDLVFFDGLGHVGIYIGGGQLIDAPHTGSVVRVDSLSSFGSFDGARRVP